MKNVGIDLGATYTVISHLAGKAPQAIEPREGGHSPCRDSLVTLDKRGRAFTGLKARSRVNDEKVRVFRAFKMLLGEKDIDRLKARGYDEENTPPRIMEKYLFDLIDEYVENENRGEPIEKLVLGVPEIWFSSPEETRSRGILEQIISAHPKVKSARLVSEPALACAYFIHNYKLENNKDFKGHVLIVDYGGGTLDASLCKVGSCGGGSQVTVIKRAGRGEIGLGCGGMLFLETALDAAIGLDDIKKGAEYQGCILALEEALMINGDEVRDTLNLAKDDRSILSDAFKTVTYKGKKRVITYKHLKDAYDAVIRPVLGETLEEMAEFISENKIQNLCVVPVGGFCNFCLTTDQIENTSGLIRRGEKDGRYKDLQLPQRDREKAISFGAALVANDVVSFKQLAPYTLSIVAAGKGGKPDFAQSFETVRAGMEIQPNVPVMAKHKNGDEVLFLAKSIPYLRVDFERGMYKCLPPAIPIEIPSDNVVKLGFSLDESAIIALHIVDMGEMGRDFDPKGKGKEIPPVRLSDIFTVFGGFIALEELK